MPDTIRTTEVIGDNYVDEAEEIMDCLMNNKNKEFDNPKNYKAFKEKMTTSKIRNILSMVNDIYNREFNRQEENLRDESNALLQRMRVRLVYEAGRTPAVKKFVQRTKLLDYIAGVEKNRENFLKLARYMEALVAYHRYFGGKE